MQIAFSVENENGETMASSMTLDHEALGTQMCRDVALEQIVESLTRSGFEWTKLTVEVQTSASEGAS